MRKFQTVYLIALEEHYASLLSNTIQGQQALGVTELNDTQIKVYPNPVKSILTIEADGVVEVSLYNLEGKKVLSNEAGVLDVKSLIKGLYVLWVKTNQGWMSNEIQVK